jgi:glycerate dehydrogenase
MIKTWTERIVVLDGQFVNTGDLSWSPLEALGELTVHTRTHPVELISRLDRATAVFNSVQVFDRQILAQCPMLRYIGLLSTGCETVDLEAAKALGITVTNVPGYSGQAVSQHALALLLSICNKVGEYSREVACGGWIKVRRRSSLDWPIIELAGQTMGIIGLGHIGQCLATTAAAMGMAVLADKAHPAKEPVAAVEYVPFGELLARSDVISLCCSLTGQTRGMINQESIAQMKDGVIIINISRGLLINEADLAQALRSGKVLAAGLDVVSEEPIKLENPLFGLENCLITPHLAASGQGARFRLLALAAENYRSFLAGKPINVLNK